MSLKLLIVLFFLGLSACGSDSGGRRGSGNFSGIQGFTPKERDAFKSLLAAYDTSKLRVLPKNGDSIQYEATYFNDQSIQFPLEEDGGQTGRHCHYTYKKVLIDETLVVDDSGVLKESRLSRTPLDPVYADPTGIMKEECEKLREGKFPQVENIDVDIATRLANYKKSLINHFSNLIDICRGGGNLEAGRCLELEVQTFKEEAATSFSGTRIHFESLIRTAKGTTSYNALFSLDFAQFYFGGMLFQEGASGVLVQGDNPLQGLLIKKHCLGRVCP